MPSDARSGASPSDVSSGWILLTNDDGVGSPALRPFAASLSAHHRVRTVVPDRERSWSGKALSRFGALSVEDLTSPLEGWAHTGLPADGVQLGVQHLADDAPDLVVSGINIGHNHGAAYVWSSGTVGAVIEGWALGVPGVAFSTGTMTDWPAWREAAMAPGSADMWERLASVCLDILSDLLADGTVDGADVVNVNLPHDADASTERRRTTLAATGYGGVFRPEGGRRFVHDFDGSLFARRDLSGTDVEAARDGVISITALNLAPNPVA